MRAALTDALFSNDHYGPPHHSQPPRVPREGLQHEQLPPRVQRCAARDPGGGIQPRVSEGVPAQDRMDGAGGHCETSARFRSVDSGLF